MMKNFEVSALQKRYGFIDECPLSLLPAVVTLPIGTLDERVAGVRKWSDSLLNGCLPPQGTWPGAPLDIPVRRALNTMGIARFCKDQPELVEALMSDILSAFSTYNEELRSAISNRLLELERFERTRQGKAEVELARLENRPLRELRLDQTTLSRLHKTAESEINGRNHAVSSELIASWNEQVRAWTEISDIFGDLGKMLGRGWDMSTGILQHTGWLDLLRLKELIERLPQLRQIINALGRLHFKNDDESVAEKIFSPIRRLEEEHCEVRTPYIPAEIRGIERSGEIARMLPTETTILGHLKLRFLWHARRAERALMTYRVEGVEIERKWTEVDDVVSEDAIRPRHERGPIIAVIDTSGSMHGLPERVAKAIVLEAICTAHAEKRKCFLYSYSSRDQVLEHELSLSPDGIEQFLSFLGFSFGGGNDETGMMSKVVTRITENEWSKADVLFVSDGEWPATASLVNLVEQTRKNGTRFHGIQIGNRGKTGLHAICNKVHVFNDWLDVGSA